MKKKKKRKGVQKKTLVNVSCKSKTRTVFEENMLSEDISYLHSAGLRS